MRKGTFVLLIIALFAISWPGCERREVPAPKAEDHPLYKRYRFSNDEKVIEIGAPTPWSTVSHIIEVMKRDEILKNDMDRMGYTVALYPFLKGEEINHFIKKGQLEGAIMGDMPTLRSAAEGRITVISLFHKGSVSLVSRDFYRVRDLKNKRVAYPLGSTAHYHLMRLLQEQGLSMDDIQPAPMNTTDMIEAMRHGRIDALTTFEPTATVFTRIDPTLHAINRSFSSYGFFSVRKEYAKKHSRAMQALRAAQFRAMAWLRASERNLNRASRWVAETSGQFVSLPLEHHVKDLDSLCAEDMIPSLLDYSVVMDRDVLGDNGDLHREFEFLKRQGLIPPDRQWHEIKADIDAQAPKGSRPATARVRP